MLGFGCKHQRELSMRNQTGQTLVQLMVAIFVVGIIGFFGSQFAADMLKSTTRANMDMGRVDAKNMLFEAMDCCTTLGGQDIYDPSYTNTQQPFRTIVSDDAASCVDIYDAADTTPSLTVASLVPAPDPSVTSTWILRRSDGTPIGNHTDPASPPSSFRLEIPFGVEIGTGIVNRSFNYQVTCQEDTVLDIKYLQLSLSSESQDTLVANKDLSVPVVFPNQLCAHIFEDGFEKHCSQRSTQHTSTTAGAIPTGGCGPDGTGDTCVPLTCADAPQVDPNYCFDGISVIADPSGTGIDKVFAAPNCGAAPSCTGCNVPLSSFGTGPLSCMVGNFWCPSRNLIMDTAQANRALQDNGPTGMSPEDIGCPGGALPCQNTSICGCEALPGTPNDNKFRLCTSSSNWPMGLAYFVEGDIQTGPMSSTSYTNPADGHTYTCSSTGEYICPAN